MNYELAQLEQEKSKQSNTSIINSKLLNDEIKNATPKPKKSSQAEIKNSEQKAAVARKKSIQNSQIALAKSEGISPEQIKARKLVTLDYLQSNGFTEDQIFDALGSSDGTKDGGIDLTKPLEVISFPPPDTMTQFVASHGYPGNWFDPLSNQTPDLLGISGEGRTKKTFTVVKGTGLKPTAKPVEVAEGVFSCW